jgi:hypothetical protein
MSWTVNKLSKRKLIDPILIEGLPGVGNVGKMAVEYLIDALDAKKIYEIHSNENPHYVFVNENNIIEMPGMSVYSAKIKDKNLLLLSGDLQPQNEASCHSFCNKILDTMEKENGKEIITLGGIGLHEAPKNPEIYFTANSEKTLKKYRAGAKTKKDLHEFIGPIVGVTGLLPGLAAKRKLSAATLLIETFEDQQHIGLNEAKEIVKYLNKKLKLSLKEKDINKELKLEELMPEKEKRIKQMTEEEDGRKQRTKEEERENTKESLNYIG